MLTTPEEPVHCVGQLKNRNVRSPSILKGHYRLKEDRVTIILQRQDVRNNNSIYKRNRRRDNMHENAEQTFHMVSNNYKITNDFIRTYTNSVYFK